MITRRGLIGILAGAIAAPIVVRSGLLMPVKQIIMPEATALYIRYSGQDGLNHALGHAIPYYDGPQHEIARLEWRLMLEQQWEKAVG